MVELAVEWDDLGADQARLAAALRLFVITRDPLDWLPNRGHAWATANADGDTVELPVYVPLVGLRRRTKANGGDFAMAVGQLTEPVVRIATRCQGIILAGAYPELAHRREAPGLIDDDGEAPRFAAPTVTLCSPSWEPIGLGAIQDLVQAAFGPVELNRSVVRLPPSNAPQPDCPACAGIRFGFPGELSEAQAAMCPPHRVRAEQITASRIAQARASNPAGWRAIGKASARTTGLTEPSDMPAPERRHARVGRNDPCPCGSGRKSKHCCGR